MSLKSYLKKWMANDNVTRKSVEETAASIIKFMR